MQKKNQIITNQAISASAGTGKTYALAVRYIRLLAAGATPESIAAMTFTRKAAGEILDRIITIICTWIKDPSEFEKQKAVNDLAGLDHDKLYEILKYKYRINSNYDACSYPGIQSKFYYNMNSESST